MNKIRTFFSEVYAEMRKVVWPSWDSVVASTKVVIVSTLLFAIFFFLIDFGLTKGIDVLF